MEVSGGWGVVRGGGTARSWGRWRLEGDASEGVGDLGRRAGGTRREYLSKRSKAVCLRRVGIGGKRCFYASVMKVSVLPYKRSVGQYKQQGRPSQLDEHIKTF